MNIVITGANGQLGKALLKQHLPYNVTALSHKDLDICNSSKLTTVIESLKPNVIINLAAYTNVDQAEINKVAAYNVNCKAVAELAKLCEQHHIFLIHISTDYVFNSNDYSVVFNETAQTNPINYYGVTKLQGEHAVSENTTNFLIIRSSWLFSEEDKSFISKITLKALQTKELTVVNDQIGNPTSAHDLANFISIVLENLATNTTINRGIYHYCGQPAVTWFDFAVEIVHQLKLLIPELSVSLTATTLSELNLIAQRPMNSQLAIEKTINAYKIPIPNWKIAIKNILKNILTNERYYETNTIISTNIPHRGMSRTNS